MEVIKEQDKGSLLKVVEVLKNGGVVAMPTDTVYGLTADARNEAAVKKIFELKKRPEEKMFPVFVRDLKMAKKYAVIDEKLVSFLERIWPGKVTVVFRAKNNDLKIVNKENSGLETVALRVSGHHFLRELFELIDFPLAQTSVNFSGRKEATSVEEVFDIFRNSETKPDLIVDGGKCLGMSSTIVDLSDVKPRILREGAAPRDEIEELLRKSGFV